MLGGFEVAASAGVSATAATTKQLNRRAGFMRAASAITIQFNHEWTRINTNENKPCQSWSRSTNGEPSNVNEWLVPVYFICVHSCLFVVPDRIVSAQGSEDVCLFPTQYNFEPVRMNRLPWAMAMLERKLLSPSSPIAVLWSTLNCSPASTTKTSPRKFMK